MNKGRCAITGTTGFLGGYLAEKMKESGWNVRKLQRNTDDDGDDNYEVSYFSLDKKPNPESLSETDVLIHCAYDFSCTSWEDINEINVKGTNRLFEAATEAGVKKIVFISSIHSFDGCRTMYGRAKLASEKAAFDHGAIVLRPDTIYGEANGKLFGGQGGNSLQLFSKLFKILPVMPIPYSPKPTVYTSHIDDICSLIEESITSETVIDRPVYAVNENIYTLKQFFKIMKDKGEKKNVLFLPVPWKIVWFLLLALEKIKIKLSFRSESILIFFDQNPDPDLSVMDRFNTKIRPF